MYCSECGENVVSGEKFCSKCGTKIVAEIMQEKSMQKTSTSEQVVNHTQEISNQAKIKIGLTSLLIVFLISMLFMAYVNAKREAEDAPIREAASLEYEQRNIAAGRDPHDPGSLPAHETANSSVASNPILTNEGVQYTQCDEPIRISDCSFQNNITPYCTFENTSKVVLTGRVFSWQYDQNGVLLNKSPSISLEGLQPGHKKREWLGHGSNHGAVKYVICSVDPESEFATGVGQ